MAISQSQLLPAPFLTDVTKGYAKDIGALTAAPLKTADFAPTVAPQDIYQTDAYTMAGTAGQGIGAYDPYITKAGAYSGPTAYEAFETPYQQDIIKTTMDEYDVQAGKGLTGIGSLAAKSGNLGGGREGVMRSEYQTQSDLNRAMLLAQLQQQGFGQAQKGAELGFNQQMQMAGAVPGMYGRDIATLGSAGAIQQAQEQATLDAQREANRLAAYDPYERLGYMGAGIGNILGGMQGQYQTTVAPNQSALQQAMGILGTGIGAYKSFLT